jgi:hypothetical protein
MHSKVVHIMPLGRGFALITPVGDHMPVDPGWGVGGLPGVPVDPGWGVGHPGGHPDQGLPEPPTIPGVPDNTLPTNPPPAVPPGMALVMVRTPDGKWKWAAVPMPSVPTPLPEPPPTAAPKA